MGEELVRQVPLPTGRKRVARCVDVVEKLAWTRCEVLDKGGGTLAVADNDAPATEPEELTSPEAAREERILRMMLRAQEVALSHRLKESEALSKTMVECMGMMTTCIKTLAAVYREQAEVAGQLGEAKAIVGQVPPTEEQQMDSVMKQLVVGQLLQTFGAGGGTPPAGAGGNGAGH